MRRARARSGYSGSSSGSSPTVAYRLKDAVHLKHKGARESTRVKERAEPFCMWIWKNSASTTLGE